MTTNNHAMEQQEYSLVSQAEQMSHWPEHMKVFRMGSDAMYPTLNEGDYVVVDTTKKSQVDGLFALQFPGELVIKRLQLIGGGKVLILNDNKLYGSEEIEASSLGEEQIIGRIVFLEKRVF